MLRFTGHIVVAAAIAVVCSSALQAQYRQSIAIPEGAEPPVSVHAAMQGYDADLLDRGSRFESPLPQMSEPQYDSPKSPWLAALLSAAVPGAGDIYAENYAMASLFLVLEAGGWYLSISNENMGDEKTVEFENFADDHWSAVKYANWLNENATKFEHNPDEIVEIEINPNENLPHWQRVNWDQMNQVELAVPVFSHKLPMHGEQQYFELIGKYHQYTYGWDDKISVGNDVEDYREISDNFSNYRDMRGDANDYYNASDLFINLIVLNHVLAAANAAWSAARFNDRLDFHSQVEVRRTFYGAYEAVPTATFSWRF